MQLFCPFWCFFHQKKKKFKKLCNFLKERIYISTFSLAGSMKTFLFALNKLRPKQETWVRNRFFRLLAGGSVHKQHWLVKKASGRKTQHNTLPATTRSLKSAFRFMGNPATLSKENNIKSSQLQGERVAARPQKRGEPRINHVAVTGSVLTASQHWRWKNICSPKGHFPHWLRGEVSEQVGKFPSARAVMVPLGPVCLQNKAGGGKQLAWQLINVIVLKPGRKTSQFKGPLPQLQALSHRKDQARRKPLGNICFPLVSVYRESRYLFRRPH